MLVREIMTCPAFSVHRESSLDEALQLMAERTVTSLPVVDDEDVLVGVLSEIDLLRRAVEADRRAHATPVHESEPLPETVGVAAIPVPAFVDDVDDPRWVNLARFGFCKRESVIRDALDKLRTHIESLA